MSDNDGLMRPFSASSIATASWGQAYPQASTTIASVSQPSDWFGPGQPLGPMAPQTAGRAFDFAFGWNLNYNPRSEEEISFHTLRTLADSLPLLRIVIEKRKDQIAGWKWDIQPRMTGQTLRKPHGYGQDEDPRITEVRAFLSMPDRRNPFHTWVRMLLEDMLVIDAATIYPRKTRGGDLYSLDVVDGATIMPLIGEDGRPPLPPDPCFQQVLKGIPASNFTFDELRYLPRNRRSNRIYGLSPVEQIIMTVNIALRRDVFNLEYYNTGSIPDAYGTLPEGWTTDQIREFQTYWDALMAGNLAKRRGLKFMPNGFKAEEMRSPPLKDQYDDWLARVICAAFSIPVAPFVQDVNRATAQSIQVTASQEGIVPMQGWVKSFMDLIIQRDMGYADLEFVWSGASMTDPLIEAQMNQIYIQNGVKSRDEVRVSLGLDAWGIGPTVSGPITPLIEAYQQAKQQVANPQPNPAAPGQAALPGAATRLGLPAPTPPNQAGGKPFNATLNHVPNQASMRPSPTGKPDGRAPSARMEVAPAAKAATGAQVNAAGVILRAPSGRVLFLLRSADSDSGSTWAFPGGGVEDGESDEEAVVRECGEEIGYMPDVGDLELVHQGANGYRTFVADVDNEFLPELNDEHEAYAWADPATPPEPTHPGVAETLGATELDKAHVFEGELEKFNPYVHIQPRGYHGYWVYTGHKLKDIHAHHAGLLAHNPHATFMMQNHREEIKPFRAKVNAALEAGHHPPKHQQAAVHAQAQAAQSKAKPAPAPAPAPKPAPAPAPAPAPKPAPAPAAAPQPAQAPASAASAKYNEPGYQKFKIFDNARSGASDLRSQSLNAAKSGLTSSEESAVLKYTGSFHDTLNSALRKGDTQTYASEVKALDSAVSKLQLQQDVTLFRGVSPGAVSKFQNSLVPGAVISDKGFVSTSTSFNTAQIFADGGMVLQIYAKKGSKAVPINGESHHPNEAEVLLPRGSQFKVLKVEGNKIHVELI
jgi:8-oxo-dGTP pyrophosphatase MutT (NUDIX family)